MAKTCSIPAYFIVFFIISPLISIVGKLSPWTNPLPPEIFSLDIANKLRVDLDAIKTASTDFGNLVHVTPAAVLRPSSINDIVDLIKFSHSHSVPFGVAARGHGHSSRGQAMADNGVVVDMSSLNNNGGCDGIRVSWSPALGFYADVGGEKLWIDVLSDTLEHGLAPVSWTDYLYLSVGGTLSNAGISGQSFRYGPQISNVHEMDIITGEYNVDIHRFWLVTSLSHLGDLLGTGELVTCSKQWNSELFFAVLGGLGQFGIITRARIVLDKAPNRVKWVRLLYSDFSTFTRDQEKLISTTALEYLEGSLIMQQSPPNNWRSSFFSLSDQSRIASLLSQHGIIYCLEVVKYYEHLSIDTVDEELQVLLQGLNFLPGLMFKKDVPFVDFLNRVRSGELKLQSKGLWDVPHPWLNLLVPKSHIMDFNEAVFVNIIHRQNKTTGPILVYPTTGKKWDDRMSAVIPDEDTFYCVGFLRSTGFNDWEVLDDQNKEILQVCEKSGIKMKQYLPHYKTKEGWMNHFGSKWNTFQDRKSQFDPKMILSPGQGIFNSV
ncbi:unnamed protein product [Ilex paraguariensis]|uniref:cytokinin dehydrogenase n=1 Tax=Ilex paraguariensis TaxID=185542 RepID=A0ABC8TCB4_9AQUA